MCYNISTKNGGRKVMAKAKWYKWVWADGTISYCRGYDRTEKAAMERNHGKLLSKTLAY
jgi:hypothetical protein